MQTEYAPVQVRADLVRLASTDGVALRAPCLEQGRTLGRVTWRNGARGYQRACAVLSRHDDDAPAEKGISREVERNKGDYTGE